MFTSSSDRVNLLIVLMFTFLVLTLFLMVSQLAVSPNIVGLLDTATSAWHEGGSFSGF